MTIVADDKTNAEADERLLAAFAAAIGVEVSCDECGNHIIEGTFGNIECVDGLLYACLWGKEPSRNRRSQIRKIKAGTLTQLGEDEAVFSFSPDDADAAKRFIAALGIKRKCESEQVMPKERRLNG